MNPLVMIDYCHHNTYRDSVLTSDGLVYAAVNLHTKTRSDQVLREEFCLYNGTPLSSLSMFTTIFTLFFSVFFLIIHCAHVIYLFIYFLSLSC